LLNYSAFDAKGAMVYDTCAGKIKRWSGSAWIAVADSGAGGGASGDYVDTIYRKAGQDSIFFTINGGSERAVKDSVGSGGGGGTPGGSTTQVQFNLAGAFGANSTFVYNGNLGLGISTPQRRLHVYGDTAAGPITVISENISTSAGATLAALEAKNSNDAGRIFKAGTGYNVGTIDVAASDFGIVNGNTGKMVFANQNTTGSIRFVPRNKTFSTVNFDDAVLIKQNFKSAFGQLSISPETGTGNQAIVYESYYDAVGTRLMVMGLGHYAGGTDPNYYFANEIASGGTIFRNSSANIFHITNDGSASISASAPVASARLELTSTTKGFLRPRMTTAQRNAIASPAAGLSVYNSSLATNDVYTTAWYQQPNGLSGSGTLDFPSTGAHSSSDLTITVTGAAVGDIVILGTPVQDIDGTFTAFVSVANTVTVRFNHYGSGTTNPASGTFKVYVIKN
jgi:hypothetical protein